LGVGQFWLLRLGIEVESGVIEVLKDIDVLLLPWIHGLGLEEGRVDEFLSEVEDVEVSEPVGGFGLLLFG
jgi:hypothetical protein